MREREREVLVKSGCINSFYPIYLYVYVTANSRCILPKYEKHIRWLSPICIKCSRKYFICLCIDGFQFAYISFRLSDGNYLNFKCVWVCGGVQHKLFWYFKMELLFHPNAIRETCETFQHLFCIRMSERCDKNFPKAEPKFIEEKNRNSKLFSCLSHGYIDISIRYHLLYPWARTPNHYAQKISLLNVGRISTSSSSIVAGKMIESGVIYRILLTFYIRLVEIDD